MVKLLEKWTIFSYHLSNGDELNVNFLSQRPVEITGDHLILTLGQGQANVVDHGGEESSPVVIEKVIEWASSYFVDYDQYVSGNETVEIVLEVEENSDGSTT